ncbi:MAG: penicillin-binding transpeptidase domain-containing protein [Nitrosomonadales bacterium]
MRNHAVTDLFEPGSTMKPFTVATALEEGKVTPQTRINTENGVFMVGGAQNT